MSEVRTPPKRLVDLNPCWGSVNLGGGAVRERVSVEFDCPCGAGDACPWGGRVWVPLSNPLDGGANPWGTSGHVPRAVWQCSGDTFETLTLTPSIHAVGHWHGFVTNGLVTSC